MEQWLNIKGYNLDNRFQVSNKGRIRNTKTGRIRKLTSSKGGYLYVSLREHIKPYKVHSLRVNVLVARAFLDNYYKGCEVDHINKVVTDNRVENLRCISKKENLKNRQPTKHKNQSLHKCTLVNTITNEKLDFNSHSLLAEYLNISRQSVYQDIKHNWLIKGKYKVIEYYNK